ncbi:imelysin family protein [Algicella marina]|uniref:Peptidase M75 n=1 Tax=Algicella marina TaxID=2683284 RepID=A0A6P1T1V0_9RHOB|nr:imelysin family protein [Algicella marina]QHQ35259.1 peptidase M75 [Algicella marina]
MMKKLCAALVLFTAASPLCAQNVDIDAAGIVSAHVLPRFEALESTTLALENTAKENCAAGSPELKRAYHSAFDAWISASHLRFGPTEVQDRAFALAFWPDTRGATPRSLRNLITDKDAVVDDAGGFREVSVAARGFYALEFLLFEPEFANSSNAGYRCHLLRAIVVDIHTNAAAILSDWQEYSQNLDDEITQKLFKSLTSGLQFAIDVRLARPLGTFERPRPARADAHRSGRSLHHIELITVSLRDLAVRLAEGDSALQEKLDRAYQRTLTLAGRVEDPVFADIGNPQERLAVESLQQAMRRLSELALVEIGPKLGVVAGFNSMDGD